MNRFSTSGRCRNISVPNANPKEKAPVCLLSLLLAVVFPGCSVGRDTGEAEKGATQLITAKEAKEWMDSQSDYIILDVRRQSEYDRGHIPNALLLPLDQIEEKAESILSDKEQTILVYCRSGRRSQSAAQVLAALGYTDVRDFGGITDWPYDIVRD